jgi:hypothetical protein
LLLSGSAFDPPVIMPAACAVPRGVPGVPAIASPADSIRKLYESGRSFREFLGAAKARIVTWQGNYGRGSLDPALLARAEAVPGTWRLLVIAEDWCGDSANTIPYVATLVDSLAGRVEMRVVRSTPAHWLLERHQTWDGRAATPTIVLLDEQWNDVGCWLERPSVLAAWTREQQPKLSHDEFLARKYAWYDADRGRETVREVVEMMERARAGAPGVCGGNAQ